MINLISYFKSERGVALYLALAILTLLLSIALGISTIIFGQLETLKTIGHSVVAFYAADTGIERELDEKNYATQPPNCSDCFSYLGFVDLDGDGGGVSGSCPGGLQDADDACYEVTIERMGPVVLRSLGSYKNITRALQISF